MNSPPTGIGSHPELLHMDLSFNTPTVTTVEQRRRCEVLLANAPFEVDEASGDEAWAARARLSKFHVSAHIAKKSNRKQLDEIAEAEHAEVRVRVRVRVRECTG